MAPSAPAQTFRFTDPENLNTFDYSNWYSASSDYSTVLTDDSRKCQLDGCRKKHAFARGIRGNKVYSAFCADHTCAKPYSEAEGFHCSTPRKAGERYCPDHLKCIEPGCNRQGEFVGTGEYIPWVCVSHRCTSLPCRSRATDRNQQRCPAHIRTCPIAACTRPLHVNRDGLFSPTCAVHYSTTRCLWDGCARDTPSSTRYCPSHRCRFPGCFARRLATADADACAEHACAAAGPTPCPATRRIDGGSAFCGPHSCRTRGCRSPARAMDEHCVRHACEVVGCGKEKAGLLLGARWPAPYPERCEQHALAKERRRVSVHSAGRAAGWEDLDVERLRERFGGLGVEVEEEGVWERRGKRWSDDLEGVRSRGEERERERERELGRRREEVRKLREEMRQRGAREDSWDRF